MQRKLAFPNRHGGNRKHDWPRKQKRKGIRCPVPHRKRAEVQERFPVHVTMRVREGLESLRKPEVFAVVREALAKSKTKNKTKNKPNWTIKTNKIGKTGKSENKAKSRSMSGAIGGPERELGSKKGLPDQDFRLNQFSVQSNHLHLIVEARDRVALSRGMQSLATRMAMALNRFWKRRGSVFAERYHSLALRSATQVRNALRYVLSNALKHGLHLVRNQPDPCSSGAWFDGWRNLRARSPEEHSSPVVAARGFLQRVAWRKLGLLDLNERPRGAL